MLCPRCGKSVEGTEKVTLCPPCQEKEEASRPTPTHEENSSPNQSHTNDYNTSESTAEIAGFWFRLASFITDGAILYLLMIIVSKILFLIFGSLETAIFKLAFKHPFLFLAISAISGFSFAILGFFLQLLWSPIFESSKLSATPGKAILGMKVVNSEIQPISFGTAFIRQLLRIPGNLFFFAGNLLAAFTKHKQALHELATNTYVIRSANTTPARAISCAVVSILLTGLVAPREDKNKFQNQIDLRSLNTENINIPGNVNIPSNNQTSTWKFEPKTQPIDANYNPQPVADPNALEPKPPVPVAKSNSFAIGLDKVEPLKQEAPAKPKVIDENNLSEFERRLRAARKLNTKAP